MQPTLKIYYDGKLDRAATYAPRVKHQMLTLCYQISYWMESEYKQWPSAEAAFAKYEQQ